MLRISSPKGYEFGRRNVMKLPSRRTLGRYVGSATKNEDLEKLIENRLCAEAASFKKPIEKLCSLVIDDMSIKEKMYYSRTEDKFYGLNNTGSVNDIGSNPVFASKMCFVMNTRNEKVV